MNISVLGVIPAHAMSRTVVAEMVAQTLGPAWAVAIACLIMWTAFSSVFALLMGYSRVPYAAALDGNYFRDFWASASEEKFSGFFAAGAGGCGGGVLLFAARAGDCRAGGDPHRAAVSAAAGGSDGAAGCDSRICRVRSESGFIRCRRCWRWRDFCSFCFRGRRRCGTCFMRSPLRWRGAFCTSYARRDGTSGRLSCVRPGECDGDERVCSRRGPEDADGSRQGAA